MSKERELLKRTLKYIVPKDAESLDYDLLLYSQIRDLLAQPEQIAWVWNPANNIWEQVCNFGHWQSGAIYAFGDTKPAEDENVQSEQEPIELEDVIKQIHNKAFYEGNSHVISVRDVLTIFRNYLKSKRDIPKQNLIDLNQVDDHLKKCDKSEDYRDGYCDGIIYAEREHKIRGKYE
jgi:hypothetical protein